MTLTRRQWLFCATASSLASGESAWCQADPKAGITPSPVDEVWFDPQRQRKIPLRVRWPSESWTMPTGGRPVVLFSHGLGGTVAGGELWGQAWSAAGCVVLHLQHPGSDLLAVRRQARDFGDRGGLRQAAGPEQLLARLQDVTFVLDELARRHAASAGRWAEVRPQGVGMSGHSFGAHTTLGMAGQRYPGHPGFNEPRLAAFIAFSPTLPAQGDAVQAFARLTRPVLCLTGSRDDDVIGNGATPDRRMGVFAALPAGQKAQLVLENADHMTFAGQSGAAVEILPRHTASRALQPQHHAFVAALTTDWWRAHLMNDAQALQRLAQPTGLSQGDRWQMG